MSACGPSEAPKGSAEGAAERERVGVGPTSTEKRRQPHREAIA